MGTIKIELEGEDLYLSSQSPISTDLPAEHLGKLLAEVIHRAWKYGADPVKSKITITFS